MQPLIEDRIAEHFASGVELQRSCETARCSSASTVTLNGLSAGVFYKGLSRSKQYEDPLC